MKNYNFFGAKIAKLTFFQFFHNKKLLFVSNLNDNFPEASFEVHYVSVSPKLAILEFSPQIFFILTSVTSETSWGQTMSLSDLNEVSNFSWRCQLSYETIFFDQYQNWSVQRPLSLSGSFWPRSLLIPLEANLWASATSMRSQILAEDASFYMTQWFKMSDHFRKLILTSDYWKQANCA